MNKRLKELMIEAGYAAPELAGRANKLAELIIQECCQALWTDACNMSDLAVEEFNSNSRKIKRHFGVE